MKVKNIFEMSTVFSAGMEDAITLAWNNEDLNKYEKQKELAIKTIEYLKEKGLDGKATHLTGYYPTSKKWQDFGGSTNSLSKTDLTIGDAKISLKVGSAQLMSGGKEESKATLYAVANKIQHKEAMDKIVNLIDNFIQGIANDTVGKARKYDDMIKKGDEIHNQLTKILTDIFNQDNTFKIAFLKESISGEIKFGKNSDACANYILSLKTKQPTLKYINNDCVKTIANNIKVNVSYKTDSMRGKNIGKYSYRSALRILVNKITEEFNYNSSNELNENILNDFWQKIKNFIVEFFIDIKEYLSKGIENIFNFLEIEPEIIVEGEINI